MKALTIHQPYASFIALGEKRFETRHWSTTYRGPIAIHAGKVTRPVLLALVEMATDPMFKDICRRHGLTTPGHFPWGSIVATANLIDCFRMSRGLIQDQTPQERRLGNWEVGRFAWEIDDITILPKPIETRGYQGLWDWEPEPGRRSRR